MAILPVEALMEADHLDARHKGFPYFREIQVNSNSNSKFEFNTQSLLASSLEYEIIKE